MAQQTFGIASANDDGYVYVQNSASYPPTGTPTVDLTQAYSYAWRGFQSGGALYRVWNTLLRWDTSSLGAVATVTAATLRLIIIDKLNPDTRNLTGDYYTWTGVAGDWTDTPGTNAFSGLAIDSLPAVGSSVDITLSNLSNISLTGTTYIRLHVDGGQPVGDNYVGVATFESNTYAEPQLIVDYTVNSTRMAPDAILAQTNLTGTVTAIQDDPDSADANWLTAP